MRFLTPVILLSATVFSAAHAESIEEQNVNYSNGHYLAGEPIPMGNDPYGYNYQAHKFSGSYFNAYAGKAGLPPYPGDDDSYFSQLSAVQIAQATKHWAWPYRYTDITMKWNDAWLSNQDRDGDGALDRHWGYSSYIGSGAWEMYSDTTWGESVGTKGNMTKAKISYSAKIVAVPDTATKTDGVWYNADGEIIGNDIWNEFAIVQEVINDPESQQRGKAYASPHRAGLGGY